MNTVTLQNWQLWVLALAASVIVSALSWLGEKVIPWLGAKFGKSWNIDFGRTAKEILLVLASAGLAWWWFPFTLPVFPALAGLFWDKVGEVIQWLLLAAKALSPYLGAAAFLYNLILTYILDPDKRLAALQQLWAMIQAMLATSQAPEPANPPSNSDANKSAGG